MLVLFKFKNFRPFKEEACFDMRAINAYKEHPYNVIDMEAPYTCLKVASVFGANASGKSNFVKAYYAFRLIVLNSFTRNEKVHNAEGGTVLHDYYYPFLFDPNYIESDTEFEAVFITNGVEYRYGYSFNETQIQYEWLYRKPLKTGRTSVIVERSPEDGIVLGNSVKRSLEKYKSNIDNDVLVLSFFSSLKLKTTVFSDVLSNIKSILAYTGSLNLHRDKLIDFYFENENEKGRQKLLHFLKAIDVGIQNIIVKRNNKKIEVFTVHATTYGSSVEVPISIESDGTKNAIFVFSLFDVALEMDTGIIIDELNLQLHPLLVKYFVDYFVKESRHAQLIYTTHDTTLLDKRYMRRDQIWFVEKNENGDSSLRSLAEYRVRNDESFEKEYLGGVFGAIPILKDFSFDNGEEK